MLNKEASITKEITEKDIVMAAKKELKMAEQSKTAGAPYLKETFQVCESFLPKTLSEDDLFKLELDAFMKLLETPKTQERIKHTLATGKPLVN